jgi:large repetitive protein
VGPDSNMWFTEYAANQIGEVNLTTGVVTETALPTANAYPVEIVAGPGGTLWYTESSGNQIGEVVASPTISTDPVNQTIVAGQTATFTAAATGFPTPTVQWQVSTNAGATFTPLTNTSVFGGVTTATLTITGAPIALNGTEYEAVFTNGVSATPTATTTAAILTVKPVLSIVPALPQGTVGVNYNQTLSVVGSTTPFNVFSVTNFNAGTTGLTLSDITTNATNATIGFSGTPTAAGTATFTISVANTAGNSLTQNMTITINPPLVIATTSLPPGTAGSNYNQTIDVVGGILPYTNFAVTNFNAGATGLKSSEFTALPASGTINVNGTPSAGGTATFTVTVTDSVGTVVTKNFTIAINPPLIITPALAARTAGTIYNQTLTVTGGGAPYTTFAVSKFSAGATGLTLANLALNAKTATIAVTGTPTAAGTASFTVNVVDAIGAVLNKTFTLTINRPLTITPSLPQGTAGTNYHQTITIAGGSTPYAAVTATAFSAGGTGLTAAALTVNVGAGTVVVNGMPTAVGTAAFTINVADAAGSHLTQAFSIAINAAPTIGNLTATQWTAGVAGFTGVSTIGGGTAPFSIASATGLPAGLKAVLTGNTIGFTGTPSTATTYAASITIHDAAGASVAKTFSITINPAPTIGNPTATQWTIGMAGFAGVLTTAGGTGGLTIASSSGLPTGLKIALTGNTIHFTGTPTAAATFAGSVTLRDAIGAAVTKTFTLTINAAPTIGNLTTTQWTAGKSGFTSTLTIAGGTGPFQITSVSGLPTGLTAVVSGNTIRITGTPTTGQTFAAGSITLHDAAGASVTKTFSITINPPVQITTASFPPAKMAAMYTAAVQAKGGTGAVTFALTGGSLPPGMKLSSAGLITGVSRIIGSFTFTITATDALGATYSQKYTLLLAL